MSIEIEAFRPEHAVRFGQLNRDWLEENDLMEESEEGQLADPEAHFIGGGGQIFVALRDGDVIGTCALLPHGADELELAKLTVSAEFRGQGVARSLVERSLAYARERGVRRVMLLSNSRLQPALCLYESLGFTYGALPAVTKYEIADVYMELTL